MTLYMRTDIKHAKNEIRSKESKMPITEKQKANLISLADRPQRERKEISRKGAEASNRKQAEKKNLIELFEIAQQAKVPDAKVAERLRKAGLPDTFAGQMAYNVIQKAGTNPLMLQTLLKALGLLNDNPNVTVNTTPIIIGNENELQD